MSGEIQVSKKDYLKKYLSSGDKKKKKKKVSQNPNIVSKIVDDDIGLHQSPPRPKRPPKIKKDSDSDASPPRAKTKNNHDSPPRSKNQSHHSPESRLKHVKNGGSSHSKDHERHRECKRSERTLDGKKAGLQNAEELKKETSDFRKRQEEAFSKMSDDVSGRNARTVLRDRRTGQKRDLAEESRKLKEEDEKRAERNAKYAVWGKGVKQTEDRQERLQQDLYEMSKPLARYADDKDLDELLKNQERDGDPMLGYIQKKKDQNEDSGRHNNKKPVYKGSYAPNRYNIRPGYRWDGVDRSNGYEKKWFDEQNSRKAREEEAFKWSTADM